MHTGVTSVHASSSLIEDVGDLVRPRGLYDVPVGGNLQIGIDLTADHWRRVGHGG